MTTMWRLAAALLCYASVSVQPAAAQDPSLAVRVSSMEEQMRHLYGQIEQLTIQMGQLAAQLQRLQEGADLRSDPAEGEGKKPSAALKPLDAEGPSGTASAIEEVGEPIDLGIGPVDLDPPGTRDDDDMTGAIETAPGPKPLGTLSGGVIDGTSAGGIDLGEEPSLSPEQVETAALGGAAIATDVPAEELYERSYESLLRKRFGEAEAGFRTFISRHRDHELAGNAQYWLGETYYAQSDYKSAAQAFLAGYQDFPTGRKAPDSLLKLGMSLKQLGQKEQACSAYATVEVKYPKAAEARKRAHNESAKAGC
jgi:tol-pal system protein YbgF